MIPAAVQADAAAQPTHPPLDAGSKPEPSAEPRGPLLGYPRWWGLPGVRDDEASDLRLLRHGLVGGRIDPAVGGQHAWGLAQALLVCRETVWHRGEILACLGEVFGPVANPYPDFFLEARPGDNLYTNSVIAVNAATGQLNWFYQAVPRDEHDWDLSTPPTLYRTPGGEDMLAVAGKSGRVYGIDRGS
jgi:hypothetical protein